MHNSIKSSILCMFIFKCFACECVLVCLQLPCCKGLHSCFKQDVCRPQNNEPQLQPAPPSRRQYMWLWKRKHVCNEESVGPLLSFYILSNIILKPSSRPPPLYPRCVHLEPFPVFNPAHSSHVALFTHQHRNNSIHLHLWQIFHNSCGQIQGKAVNYFIDNYISTCLCYD